MRKRIVILDRSLADSVLDYMVRSGREDFPETRTFRLLRFLFPRPALTFYLHVTPGESLRRKREEFNAAQLQKRFELLERLIPELELLRVETQRPVQQVVEEITGRFLEHYYG